MQVSSSALPVQFNSPLSRENAARGQRESADNLRLSQDLAVVPENERESVVERESSQLSAQQRVEARSATENIHFQRVPNFEELPANSRHALNTYLQTASTPADASAGELAGIDVFV